jgi:hypothetical protein
MGKKPRMGSDPFQKKDPLGWIGSDPPDIAAKSSDESSPPSNPQQHGNAGNPSKHELPGPPSTQENLNTTSRQARGTTTSKGLRPGWTRATFIVREDTLQKLKAVAYWDRKELKRVVEESFRAYLEGKKIKPIPSEISPEE